MPASDIEQYQLELINEARLDPLGNAARYLTSYSPLQSNYADIQSAMNHFGVNGAQLLNEYKALVAVEPLAWNEDLGDAAQKHSQLMITQNQQSHQLSGEADLRGRVEAEGYTGWSNLGENVFAYSKNPLYGHAGFMVDWGNATPGHRTSIMSSDFREAGIGIVLTANSSPNVGPQSTTQDLANRFSLGNKVIVLGVSYNDSDANKFYSVGEGVANVAFAIGAASAATAASGGYSLITTATGAQTITISGGGLATAAGFTANLVGNHNYKLDVVDPASGAATLLTTLSGTLSGTSITTLKALGTVGLTLATGAGSQTLYGAKGNDTLTGGGDADTFFYATGGKADTIKDFKIFEIDKINLTGVTSVGSFTSLMQKAADTVAGLKFDFGGGDTLTLTNVLKADVSASDFGFGIVPVGNTINGTAGNDTINKMQTVAGQSLATDYGDTIDGKAGNDMIDAAGGDDTVEGGDGDDKLAGGGGIDKLSYLNAAAAVTVSLALTVQQDTKGAGKDTISLFEQLEGSAFADRLTGSSAANFIFGGDGDDLIDGGAGSDTLDGGTGINTLNFAAFAAAVTVDLVAGTAKSGVDTDSISGFVNVTGGAGADKITGDASDNVVQGGLGNDMLDGAGNTAAGDTLSYASAAAGVTVSLARIDAQNTIGAGTDTISNFENLTGSAKDDKLTGNSAANIIIGGDGNDTIEGGGDADTLAGGNGVNTLSYAGDTAGVVVDLFASSAGGGDAQNDTVDFTSFRNLIGGAGADALTGTVLANRIDGGAGDDAIDGGAGDDILIGGLHLAGDTVSYASAVSGVSINLVLTAIQDTKGSGKDTLSGFENLTGSNFGDALIGDKNANIVDGGGGDDRLTGAAGADVLDGDTGIDTASYAASALAVTIDLTRQGSYGNGSVRNNDALVQTGGDAQGDLLWGFENIIGSAKNDTLTGDANNNVIEGGAGDDRLDGGFGIDTVSYASSAAAVTLDLSKQSAVTAINTVGAGKDFVFNFENLTGSAFNDTLTGDAADNLIDAGAGNDTVNASLGTDTLAGGIGIDRLSFAAIASAVTADLTLGTGSAAGMTLALSGFENLTGSAQDDQLSGDSLANIIIGGLGSDTISGAGGSDTLDGGVSTAALPGGNDTVDYSYLLAGQNITVALGAWTAGTGAIAQTTTSGVMGDIDKIANFENVIGGAGNDTLKGNVASNGLQGGAGDDVISGGLGADTLDGGTNAAGGDTLSYATDIKGVAVNLATNSALGSAGSEAVGDTISNFENVTGGSGIDVLIGDNNANILTGGVGSDTLSGGDGDDMLIGGVGADTIDGVSGNDTVSYLTSGAAVIVDLGLSTAQKGGDAQGDLLSNIDNVVGSKLADTLTGNGGDNVITGGLGVDKLTGAGGADSFVFNALAERGDAITDFTSGTDKLLFTKSGFVGLNAADANDFAGHYFVSAAGPAAATESGHGQFLFNQTSGQLFWDDDGTGKHAAALVFVQTNAGAHVLAASDFILS